MRITDSVKINSESEFKEVEKIFLDNGYQWIPSSDGPKGYRRIRGMLHFEYMSIVPTDGDTMGLSTAYAAYSMTAQKFIKKYGKKTNIKWKLSDSLYNIKRPNLRQDN